MNIRRSRVVSDIMKSMVRQTQLGDSIRGLLEAPGQVNDVDRFMTALDLCIAKVIRTVVDSGPSPADPRGHEIVAALRRFAADCEMHEVSASDLNADMLNIAAGDVLRGEDFRGVFYDRVRDRLANMPANDDSGKKPKA